MLENVAFCPRKTRPFQEHALKINRWLKNLGGSMNRGTWPNTENGGHYLVGDLPPLTTWMYTLAHTHTGPYG